MKILVDVNLSPLWISFLAGHGIEAVHWSTVGTCSAPDTEIFDHATANGFVVFTHDLDFGALLAQRRTLGPSVIQLRCEDVLPSAIGDTVLHTLLATQSYLEKGALVTVDPVNHRVRILPI